MSHQVKQISTVAIGSVELLGRALEAVHIPELGTSLHLDMNRKAARFWGGAMDPCDGVITFARELKANERDSYYEISLKREGEVYTLWSDPHGSDRGIEDRVKQIFQAYRVEELKQEGVNNGGAARSYDIEARPGWKMVEVEVQVA